MNKGPAQIVFHSERLEGVHPSLVAFFRDWAVDGPFPIVIPPEGGWRRGNAWEMWQAAAFARRASKAKTLEETPHGRGCAVDAYPAMVSLDGHCTGILTDWAEGRGKDAHLFKAYGARAKAAGLVWGGDWPWDAPHVEVHNWLDLPFNNVALGVNLHG